ADFPAPRAAPCPATTRPDRLSLTANQKAASAEPRPASHQCHLETADPTKSPHSCESADATSRSCRWRNSTTCVRRHSLRQQEMVSSPSVFHWAARDKQKIGPRPILRAGPAWQSPI